MNNLQVFNHKQFGEVRTITINREPWFVGKDVAESLGYSNPRKAICDHVDKEDKGVTKCDTLGGTQDLTIINESGLYSLIMSSKLPTAKQFKHWVTSEVLPSIRKQKRECNPADYYKCGLLRWSKTPLLSRITLIVSTVALITSFVVLCMKG